MEEVKVKKYTNLSHIYTKENTALLEAKKRAIQEVLESLQNHTFFEKFVHRSLSNDFFHIVEFIPYELFLEHKIVLLIKEEARNYFLSQIENVDNVADFISIVKAREEFAKSLDNRVKRAKKLTPEEINDIALNLEKHKVLEVDRINACFSSLAHEIQLSSKNLLEDNSYKKE